MPLPQIEPRELHARLSSDGAVDRPLLLDVRDADEFALCRIEGSLHIPMNELPHRLGELDPERETIVVCHHGVRSAKVLHFLLQQDFADVKNLRGGIDAWAVEVDPTLPRY